MATKFSGIPLFLVVLLQILESLAGPIWCNDYKSLDATLGMGKSQSFLSLPSKELHSWRKQTKVIMSPYPSSLLPAGTPCGYCCTYVVLTSRQAGSWRLGDSDKKTWPLLLTFLSNHTLETFWDCSIYDHFLCLFYGCLYFYYCFESHVKWKPW